MYNPERPSVIGKIRKLYSLSPSAKNEAKELNCVVYAVGIADEPVLVGYKGANEMIQAKYALNPVTKFGKFNKGKQLLEEAVSRVGQSLEMRFLGYHNELGEDKKFLLRNTASGSDAELRGMIAAYLMSLSEVNRKELRISGIVR